MGRLAVAKATERDEPAVIKYQSLLDDLLGRFVVLDPRFAGKTVRGLRCDYSPRPPD